MGIIKNNPEIFIVTDKYLKSELKAIVTFVWLLNTALILRTI